MIYKFSTSAAALLLVFGMASAQAQTPDIGEMVDAMSTPCKIKDDGLDAFKRCALDQITGMMGATLPMDAMSTVLDQAMEMVYNQTFHPDLMPK